MQINVELSEEIFSRLVKAAEVRKIKPEAMAADMIVRSLPPEANTAPVALFPGVALIKENFIPPPAVTSSEKRSCETAPAPVISRPAAAAPSPEKLQRRQQLEMQMRELSLLIETAEPDKKENYLLQYAMLAAELDSTL